MKHKEKGFTLVEVIVVLVAITILLAIAIPSVMGYVRKANEQKYISFSRNIYVQAQTAVTQAKTKQKFTTTEDINSLQTALNNEVSGEEYADYSVAYALLYFDKLSSYWQIDGYKDTHSLDRVAIWLVSSENEEDEYFVLFTVNEGMMVFDNDTDMSAYIHKHPVT